VLILLMQMAIIETIMIVMGMMTEWRMVMTNMVTTKSFMRRLGKK
jgi:hypothetical protein